MRSKSGTKTHPLGPIQVEYRDRRLTWRDLVLFFTPACLAVLSPWAYGTWRSWYASQYYGPVAAEAWGPPWFLLATVASLPLLLLVWTRLRRSSRWVRIHRDGIHVHTASGMHTRLPWEQITAVAYQASQMAFLGRVYHTHHQLHIYRVQGRPIRIDPRLNNLDDLAARIKAKRYPRLLNQLRTSYQAGETLSFGPLQIRKTDLVLQGQDYPWSQVKRVNLDAARLVVELQNQRQKSIPVTKIPNLELLLQLIDEGVET